MNQNPPGPPLNPPRQPATPPSRPGKPKIVHSQPTFGGPDEDIRPAVPPMTPPPAQRPRPSADDPLKPLPVAESTGLGGAGSKITAFGQDRRHEDTWNRTPNTTGAGAIHVKSFHCKLTDDALAYMDQTINEWLDAHPQYEVKFVSSTIGILTGKLKEPALICQVWV